MSIWDWTRSFLLSVMCVCALLLPQGAECADKAKSQKKSKSTKSQTVEDIEKYQTPLNPPEEVPEEKLTPAELKKKIATLRKRIHANVPGAEKRLLEMFDDLSKTRIGRHLIERVSPEFRIDVKRRYQCNCRIFWYN